MDNRNFCANFPDILPMNPKASLFVKRACTFSFVACGLIFSAPSSHGAELIAASFHGEIQTIDTETGALLDQFYMSTDSGTGPAGVAFRGRDTMFITVSIGFGGDKVYEFNSAAGHTWAQGLKYYQGRFDNPLFSGPSAITQVGSSGLMYAVGNTSHDLWAFAGTRVDNAGDVYLAGNQLLKFNQGGTTMYFPSEIESSPLDARFAVGAGQKLRIFNGLSMERDIALAGNIDGLAFDYIGREVPKEGGGTERHALAYVLHARQDQARIDRYDIVTGEPWGGDPADRANPIFIAPGTGGLAHYASALEIDPVTGDIYVAAANSFRTDQFGLPINCISRFDRDGKVKGLNNNETNAVIVTAFNSSELSLALRPRYDVKNFTTTGSYDFNLTPDSAGFGLAGLNFVAAPGAAGTVVTVLPSANTSPDIKVGGAESAPIKVGVQNGSAVALENLAVAANGLLEIGANSQVTANSSVEVRKGGALKIVQGIVKNLLSSIEVMFGGELSGTGSIQAQQIGLIIRGLLSPGQSPGKLNIQGNLFLADDSELKIEIGGAEQGVSYDWLEVQNTATGSVGLHGKLLVHVLNGFVPQAAQEFNFITSEGTVILNFQNAVNSRVVTADGRGTFLVKLAADNKTVQLTDYQPFTGTPYEAWAQNIFTSTEIANPQISGLAADPDLDGAVNLVEFAFNTNPKAANPEKNFSAKTAASGNVSLQFNRRTGGLGTFVNYEVGDVRIELLETTDLVTWTAVAGTLNGTVQPNGDAITEQVSLTLPTTASARFFQLRVAPK
jgi:hypothetical protein